MSRAILAALDFLAALDLLASLDLLAWSIFYDSVSLKLGECLKASLEVSPLMLFVTTMKNKNSNC